MKEATLGLSIAKEYVEINKGTLIAPSSEAIVTIV